MSLFYHNHPYLTSAGGCDILVSAKVSGQGEIPDRR